MIHYTTKSLRSISLSPLFRLLLWLLDYSGAQILNELLQNADDAGATAFKVMIDKRTSLPNSSLLSPAMANWTGPALYAFDDKSFSPEDFASIQRVGDGLKRGNPTKTGQVIRRGSTTVRHIGH